MKSVKNIFRMLTASPRRTLQTVIGVIAAVIAASPLWTLLGALLTVVGAMIDLALISLATAAALLIVTKWKVILATLRTELLDVIKTFTGRETY